MDALDKTSPSVGDTAEITELIQLRQKLEQAEEQLQLLKCAMNRITESDAWLDLDDELSKARADAEKLQETEKSLVLVKKALDYVPDMVHWVNSKGRYLYANKTFSHILGYSQEEVPALHVWDLDPKITPEIWPIVWEKGCAAGDASFETIMWTKDNRVLPVRMRAIHMELYGEPNAFVISQLIPEEKRSPEEELQAVLAQQEALLNNIPYITWLKDGDSQYIAVNDAFARFCNKKRDEVVGLTDFDLWPSEMAQQFRANDQAMIADGEKVHFEAILQDPQGNSAWYEVFKTPIHFEPSSKLVIGTVGIAQDITARKEAEEALQLTQQELERTNKKLKLELHERKVLEGQLIQVQKMKAIGQLASGVAHDFNSLLTVIMGRLKLLESHITDDAGHHTLRAASQAAERAAKLTKQLLAFARKQPLYPHAVDLNELIQEMDLLLQNALSDKIRLEKVLAEDLWPALADTNQVQLAILNLVSNACEAMPNGGLLRIGTGNIHVNADLETRISDLEPGEYIRLFVSDTGTGMSEEVLNQAFEPFFTTKGVGRGTGLGLSQVYGLAKQLGGTAQLKSTPGQGATVELFLPRALELGKTLENASIP